MDGTSKDTRVEVTSRALDANFVVVDTTKTIGKTRSLGVEPVVVRNAHAVKTLEELVLFRLDELVKVDGTALLHTLEDHLDVDGKLETKLLVSLEDVQPSHHWSLVVGRATAVEATRSTGVRSEGEWLVVPSVLLERRLNVVVSVKKYVLLELSDKSTYSTHLLGVVADLADNNWREGDLLVPDLVGANRALLSLDAEVGELLKKP